MRHSSQADARVDLTAKLRSRLFRSEFFRLFPEKSPDQADRPLRPPICWGELLSHPLAVRAAQALVGGKPAEELSLAAVVGAHLAAGPVGWHQMGLSDDEDVDLYTAYVDLLNDSNVKDVNAYLQIVEAFVLVGHGTPQKPEEQWPRREL